MANNQCQVPSLPIESMTFVKELGSGFEGIVDLYQYNEQVVALKRIKLYHQDDMDEVMNEACIMKNLDSPLVIKLVGITPVYNAVVGLGMDYMRKGDLLTLIETGLPHSIETVKTMFLQIVQGLAYLKSQNILVYFDLL